ncbi:MAG: hypothetical protein CM1200mP38_3030 [Dehalococcoidia bacterium]|nr:MAG: hypothetical protein CM1200mP38_3030 [Dehalococcoidia bacterium]
MLSTVIPGLVVVLGMWIAYSFAGTYGVALAAVGCYQFWELLLQLMLMVQ